MPFTSAYSPVPVLVSLPGPVISIVVIGSSSRVSGGQDSVRAPRRPPSAFALNLDELTEPHPPRCEPDDARQAIGDVVALHDMGLDDAVLTAGVPDRPATGGEQVLGPLGGIAERKRHEEAVPRPECDDRGRVGGAGRATGMADDRPQREESSAGHRVADPSEEA